MKIRIKFTKQGAMKFIGHLDLMRYFQKAMRRADVDILYTEGFSPHQKMSFASPLGVGLTSIGEYLDIEAASTKTSAEMLKALNDVMVEGIEILSFKKLPNDAVNAMSLVAAASYRVTAREDMPGFFAEAEALLKRDSLLITKKTKKGEREVDLIPLIYECHAEENSLYLTLSSGSTDNIKPELVLNALYDIQGKTMPKYLFCIERLEVYAENLIPLDELGEDIV